MRQLTYYDRFTGVIYCPNCGALWDRVSLDKPPIVTCHQGHSFEIGQVIQGMNQPLHISSLRSV